MPHLLGGAGGNFRETDWTGFTWAYSSVTYDELGRPRVTTLPDGQSTEARYDGWAAEAIDQKRHKKRSEADALGRLVAVKEYTGTDASWSLYATTQYGYDVADQLTTVADAAGNPTTVGYDALGRKTTMSDPDTGSWSYSYDPIGTLAGQTDAKGQTTNFYYDPLQRLTRTWYPLEQTAPKSGAWQQETITAGVSRPTVYDLMELRNAIDCDRVAAGLSAYTWTDPSIVAGKDTSIRPVHFADAASAIQGLWTAAAMGSLPQWSYGSPPSGSGARPVAARDVTDLRSWLRQYEENAWGQSRRARGLQQYDAFDGSSQFGRGKRTALWDVSGHALFTYDVAGRLKQEQRVIDGFLYATSSAYDAADRVAAITYPDSEVLTYYYTQNGLLAQIWSSLGPTLVSSAFYNAFNLLTEAWLGNGTPAKLRQTYSWLDTAGSPYPGPYASLHSIRLEYGSLAPLVDRTMTYDPVGNVTQIVDGVNSETSTFTHDDLDRLLTARGPVVDDFTYNAIGNLTLKGGQAIAYADSAHKHAASTFGATSYGYDANGCMTTRNAAQGGQTVKYDPVRLPVRVSLSGQNDPVARFVYDGDGVRRKRLDANGTIHYPFGFYEANKGNGATTTEVVSKYYSAFGRTIAVRRGGTLYWLGSDHLGSTIRTADSSFSPLDQQRYGPWGGSRDAGTNLQTDHKFTSQIEDAPIGLYWYASRAYDPALGRFVAPDTIVPGAANPQRLNRYSYGCNNPLRFTDPSGHISSDGTGLWDQDDETQQLFLSTWGDSAADEWDREHEGYLVGIGEAANQRDVEVAGTAVGPADQGIGQAGSLVFGGQSGTASVTTADPKYMHVDFDYQDIGDSWRVSNLRVYPGSWGTNPDASGSNASDSIRLGSVWLLDPINDAIPLYQPPSNPQVRGSSGWNIDGSFTVAKDDLTTLIVFTDIHYPGQASRTGIPGQGDVKEKTDHFNVVAHFGTAISVRTYSPL